MNSERIITSIAISTWQASLAELKKIIPQQALCDLSI
jgi:hypothetical protein